MREILFRGKRIDNGEWIYGNYHHFKGKADILVQRGWNGGPHRYKHVEIDYHLIIISEMPDSVGWDYASQIGYHKVIPETVSQFTGLKDNNGVRIFEGDVCELTVEAEYKHRSYEVYFDHIYTGFVKYTPSRGYHLKLTKAFDNEKLEYDDLFPSVKSIVQYRTKIIGNIFDNPDLLTKTDNNDNH